MKKVEFDLIETLGDTASSKAFGVECLNCFESGMWQLMRQYGIKEYICSLGTTAFLGNNTHWSPSYYIKSLSKNLLVLEQNLYQYYHVRKKSYLENGEYHSTEEFIKSSIEQNTFVYMLYNNYYDSLNMTYKAKLRNTYHNNVITGYDDDRARYISIMEGKFDILYKDYDAIYKHFLRRSPLVSKWSLFRLDGECKLECDLQLFRKAVKLDWQRTLQDWQEEINCFENEIKDMEKLYQNVEQLDERRAIYLFTRRKFFLNSNNGYHGNLYLKIKLLEEITGNSYQAFIEKYFRNRKQSEVIANMMGKAYVNYSHDQINCVFSTIRKVYVEGGKRLYEELRAILDTNHLI